MALFWKKQDTKEAKRWVDEGKRALDPQQKLACFNKATRADPDYAPGWSNKGYVLLGLGITMNLLRAAQERSSSALIIPMPGMPVETR